MPKLSDTEAVNKIARLLGTSPEWSSPADLLDDIAAIVAATGRDHPGDVHPGNYNPQSQ